MGDDLRRLARELGLPTAHLRSAIGPGWVRKGGTLAGFNMTYGPLYVDRPRKPRVGVRVWTVAYCTPDANGNLYTSVAVLVGSVEANGWEPKTRWALGPVRTQIALNRDSADHEKLLEKVAAAVHCWQGGKKTQDGPDYEAKRRGAIDLWSIGCGDTVSQGADG